MNRWVYRCSLIALFGMGYGFVHVSQQNAELREQQKRECTDRVLQLGTTAGIPEGVGCTHRDHVLQRGREDGTLWLCICDARGSDLRRTR